MNDLSAVSSPASVIDAKAAGKILELESLRGLAALLVVFYHVPKWNPVLDLPLLNNGYLMVDTFFVISGFVIFHAYGRRLTSIFDVLRFQFLRFGRLYAVHLLFFLVFLLIEVALYVAKSRGLGSEGTVPFAHNTPLAGLYNLLLIHGVIPGQSLTFNYPSWSISVEFVVYIAFALLVLFAGRFALATLASGAAIAIAMLVTETTFGMDFLIRGVAGFFIGCLIAAVLSSALPVKLPQLAGWVCVAGFLALLCLKPVDQFDVAIYPMTALLIVALLRTQAFAPSALLRQPALVWLGTISYSIYMSHAAIVWVANQAVKVLSDAPMIAGKDGGSIQSLSRSEALLTCAAILAAVLVTSALVYRFVERPSREASRRLVGATENRARIGSI